MRLLELDSRGEPRLTEDYEDGEIPDYAILSHTWGRDNEELTFNQLRGKIDKSKPGYTKIKFCGQQARKHGLKYFWVDTCCIDKANLVELTQAINSMFHWYSRAATCYVYLSDVSFNKRDNDTQRTWQSAFKNSRWFTRSWTLQELLAPKYVFFYSREEKYLGSKHTLSGLIQNITGIPFPALSGAPMVDFPVDERVQWASKRLARKPEDKVYCLLGICGIHMCLIYSEGEDNAMIRLREEIARSSQNLLGTSQDRVNHSDSYGHATPGITEDTLSLGRRKQLVDALKFDQMTSKYETIDDALPATCEWLLIHPEYVCWQDAEKRPKHYGFLCIRGKPGAGKSTLLKFASISASQKKSEHEIIVSYFFNASGNELEKSTNGMYRALLYQILKEAPELQTLLDDLESSAMNQILGQNPTWPNRLLRKLLSVVMTRLGHRKVTVFIDGLDECEEKQVREMIPFLEELGKKSLEYKSQLYICFSSRHYPTITIPFKLQFVLEEQHGHKSDLEKYLQKHFTAVKGKKRAKIENTMRKKARGIFMWLVLVIPVLNKEFDAGRIPAVEKRLQELPEELSALWRDILKRDHVNTADLLLCLQWVLFAKTPLKREEFYFAVISGLPDRFGAPRAWNPKEITTKHMNSFITDISKGLAELTKSQSPTVQFIHGSVRDFLIEDGGLYELWPDSEIGFEILSHDRLKKCCQSYLNVDLSKDIPSSDALRELSLASPKSHARKKLREGLKARFPFLKYASRHILYHCNEAAARIPQEIFLEQFSLETCININNMVEQFDKHCHTPEVSLLYILAEQNLSRLIETIGCQDFSLHCGNKGYQYPIFAALAKGGQNATETLVASQYFNPNLKRLNGRTILSMAAEKGLAWLVDQLLEKYKVKADSADDCLRTPLSYAAQHGNKVIVEMLVRQQGVDVNAEDKWRGETALMWAAENGHEDVVKVLVRQQGINLHRRNKKGETALMWAVKRGHEEVVKVLTRRQGINANIKDVRDRRG